MGLPHESAPFVIVHLNGGPNGKTVSRKFSTAHASVPVKPSQFGSNRTVETNFPSTR